MFASLTASSGRAYLKSALDYFWISGWLCVAMMAFVWLTRRPQRAAIAAAD
jgi:DHA2 family multidrug resistance protein